MCHTATMFVDGDRPIDRHVLRNTQRKLKMEAALGSKSAGSDQMRTPSPQRKSILSRNANQSFPGKENMPDTPPPMPASRLAGVPAPSSSPSPTKTTPLLGSETKQESLRYTSLSELVITVPNSPFCRSESFGAGSPAAAPRTPMKDALVEKAVRAYLHPSESFNARSQSSGWGMCLVLQQVFPSFITKFAFSIPNPIEVLCCAVHSLSSYMARQTLPWPPTAIRPSRST